MVAKRTLRETIDRGYVPEPNTGCWLWEGSLRNGYGAIRRGGDKMYAHRVSYEIHKGDIPNGMMVCHLCDQPLCINPDHLWLGTCAENHADRNAKGRQARGVTNHNAKFSESDIRAIREAYDAGEKPYRLSKQYGVAPSTIHLIVERKTWRHVA